MNVADPAFDDIEVGSAVTHEVSITAEMLDQFVFLSGDYSPIHVSDNYARERGFQGRVVHGLLLGALVSKVVGTQLPGKFGVLQRIELNFRLPCYPNDHVSVVLRVREKIESVKVVLMDFTVTNQNNEKIATGKVQVGLAR
jgi:3-hydroxybutyryl-CoA dehydratase